MSFVFDQGRLSEIRINLIGGDDDEALRPLKDLWKLEKKADGGSWLGLDGTIWVSSWRGDAEKQFFVIGLADWSGR